MAKDEPKKYTVQACSRNLMTRDVTANSLADAVEKANRMKESEFVSFKGEVIDGDFWITGIYEAENSLETLQR